MAWIGRFDHGALLRRWCNVSQGMIMRRPQDWDALEATLRSRLAGINAVVYLNLNGEATHVPPENVAATLLGAKSQPIVWVDWCGAPFWYEMYSLPGGGYSCRRLGLDGFRRFLTRAGHDPAAFVSWVPPYPFGDESNPWMGNWRRSLVVKTSCPWAGLDTNSAAPYHAPSGSEPWAFANFALQLGNGWYFYGYGDGSVGVPPAIYAQYIADKLQTGRTRCGISLPPSPPQPGPPPPQPAPPPGGGGSVGGIDIQLILAESPAVGKNVRFNVIVRNGTSSTKLVSLTGILADETGQRVGTLAPRPWTEDEIANRSGPTTLTLNVPGNGSQTVAMYSAGKIHEMFAGRTLQALVFVDGQVVSRQVFLVPGGPNFCWPNCAIALAAGAIAGMALGYGLTSLSASRGEKSHGYAAPLIL